MDKWGATANDKVCRALQADENIPGISGDGYTNFANVPKTTELHILKRVNFMVCE